MLAIRPGQLSTLEQFSRQQIALSVLAELRTTTPHAVVGLSPAEVDFRLDTAVKKSAQHELDTRGDVEAFVRLSFIVGPFFDEYPPFKAILASHDSPTRIPALFVEAEPDDWNAASQFDILSRSGKSQGAAAVSLTPLQACHADAYWQQALHPDVWRLGRMKPMTDIEDVSGLIQNLGADGKTGYAVIDAQQRFVGAMFVTQEGTLMRISYWIARPVWGQGVASQALMQLKGILQGEHLQLTIEPGNTPSLKVAAKCGFRQTDSLTFVA